MGNICISGRLEGYEYKHWRALAVQDASADRSNGNNDG